MLLLVAGLWLLAAIFGEVFINWITTKRLHQRENVIASYNLAAMAGKVPWPAETNLIQVIGVLSGKQHIEVKIVTASGVTQFFDALKIKDASGTNWEFINK